MENQVGAGLSSFGFQLKAIAHESKEFVPTGELEITQQSFEMLEEFSARAQSCAEQAVILVHQVQYGMEKES